MKKIEKTVTEGIGLISTGLEILQRNADSLETLTGPTGVDIAARIAAQSASLDKILTPLKQVIKVEALSSDTEEVLGVNYKATVRRVIKTILDGDKVKAFLAGKLPMFQRTQEEIRVSFSIKG